MKNQVIDSINKNKIIAIVRGVRKDDLIPLCQALYNGGIRLLELTFDATSKVSDTETAANIAMLSKVFEGKMFIGAGTVLNKKQVALTKKTGGKFIISPNVDKSVIKATVKAGLVSIPGALTPSECQTAHLFGADFVKLFPISDLGSSYVKALKAPLSHIKLLAVGGINENNMPEYLKAGVCGFGIGSNFTDKSLIANKDFESITNIALKYTQVLKNG